jgi:hypothetical protein
MSRIAATACLIAALAAAAHADRLTLADGREFEGVVTIEEDAVLIVMDYGMLRFPKDQVRKIELKDIPRVELAKRLAEISAEDPDALLSVAKWAARTGLDKKAEEIMLRVLKIDPDHAATRLELGHVKIDGKWHPLEKGIEIARGKMAAGEYEDLVATVLPRLEKVAGPRGELPEVEGMRAHALLRSQKFTAAARAFANLADKTDGEAGLRYEAIMAVLRENADGMYVLREPYPRRSALLGEGGKVVEPGPASLAEPLVLEAAIRDKAKLEIEAGEKLLAEARELEATQPQAANGAYLKASRVFARADALVEDIAHGWQVKIVRRRIALIRKTRTKVEAAKFDALWKDLGSGDMSPRDFEKTKLAMLRCLDKISGTLREILALAKPYPRELFLEVKWAESDLDRTGKIRNELLRKPHADS